MGDRTKEARWTSVKDGPGPSSGVTAGDLVDAQDLGAVAPGKVNPKQEVLTGNQWIDHGPVCDGKDDSTGGCFYSDAVRGRLIMDFLTLVQTAATNYKLALADLKVAELMKKEEDLHWLLSLALDLAGAHLLVVASKALKAAKAAGAMNLEVISLDAARRGTHDAKAWYARVDSALQRVTDKRIDSFAKTAFDEGKKAVTHDLKEDKNAGAATAKEATVAYVDQLTNQCDVAFRRFSTNALATSNDAELAVLHEGMKPELHTVGAYRAALSEKLQRFRNSGVPEIGRRERRDRTYGEAPVQRDTRVVWVQALDGSKTLWYQSQEGDAPSSSMTPCDVAAPTLGSFKKPIRECGFGPPRAREDAVLDRRVPDEFRDLALATSEKTWGPTQTIDSPEVEYWRQQGADVERLRASFQPAVAGAPDKAPAPSPTPAPSTAPVPLPANSIFTQPTSTLSNVPSDSILVQQPIPKSAGATPAAEPTFDHDHARKDGKADL